MEPFVDTLLSATGGGYLLICVLVAITLGVIVHYALNDSVIGYVIGVVIPVIIGILLFAQALDIIQIWPFEWNGLTIAGIGGA